MDLESITLSEKRQTQKTRYCMIPFIQNSRKGKTIVTKSKQISSCQELGTGMGPVGRGGVGGGQGV